MFPSAHVEGLRGFRHEPLPAVGERLLPRLEAVVSQTSNRQYHVLPVQHVLEYVSVRDDMENQNGAFY